jgi:D-alanyl-D-alanine carboxypeptidase (penicillin-binding protein 5/6)
MALIAQYCMKNQTFRNTVSKTSCTVEATDKYQERFFRNTNDLLNKKSSYYYEYAIGVKTGYTSQAKRCLIAASKKDNLELITVTLGSQPTNTDTRYTDTINLFNYGFSNYKNEKIALKDTVIEEIVVSNATKKTENLSLLIKKDITGIVPKNLNLNTLTYSVTLDPFISAPISEGAVLGKITYNIDGSQYTADLVANHSVDELNVKLIVGQVLLALLAVFILSKLLLPKKKSKKKISKNKKYKTKKRKNYRI